MLFFIFPEKNARAVGKERKRGCERPGSGVRSPSYGGDQFSAFSGAFCASGIGAISLIAFPDSASCSSV